MLGRSEHQRKGDANDNGGLALWGAPATTASSSMANKGEDTNGGFAWDTGCLVVVGGASLLTMFILAAIFLVAEVSKYTQLKAEEDSRESVIRLEAFIASLQEETEGRIAAIEDAFNEQRGAIPSRTAAQKAETLESLQQARSAVNGAADSLVDFISADSTIQSDIARLGATLALYHTNDPTILPTAAAANASSDTAVTNTSGTILVAHLRASRYAIVATLHYFQSKLPSHFLKSLQLYSLSYQSIYHGIAAASVSTLLEPSPLTTTMTLLQEVGYSSMEARVMSSFSELPFEQYGIAMSTLPVRMADEVIKGALKVKQTDSSADAGSALEGEYTSGMSALADLIAFLKSTGFGKHPGKPTTASITTISICIAYLAVVAVAFVGVVVHTVFFIRSTRRARRLLAAYGDHEGSTRSNIAAYRPVLSQMRTNVLLPQVKTDVIKQFHRAAMFILQLRPYAPQALFGSLQETHKRDPDGTWNIESQDARLEMGQRFGVCTVLTVAISSPSIRRASKETVAAVMAEMTLALNVVSRAVNSAGGIVHTICPGGKIICAWNATNFVNDVALVAVTTARVIDGQLRDLGLERDLNLATGQCITANCKVGTRKLVLLMGTPFDSAERLSLLNEEHVANLVIDADTFKELPREFQRQCKPIALISEASSNLHTVAMTADASEGLRGDQWKLYNTAFSLYQNNMVVEALTEFTKYLSIYPNDKSALWLKEHVLIGRAEAARARNAKGGGGRGGGGYPRDGEGDATEKGTHIGRQALQSSNAGVRGESDSQREGDEANGLFSPSFVPFSAPEGQAPQHYLPAPHASFATESDFFKLTVDEASVRPANSTHNNKSRPSDDITSGSGSHTTPGSGSSTPHDGYAHSARDSMSSTTLNSASKRRATKAGDGGDAPLSR